jgi:hypothetical protein
VAASASAEIELAAVNDRRHENFGAAHPGDRGEHEQQRVRVLPFAEDVRPEIAGEQACDGDRHGDLRQPLEAEPNDVRRGFRDVRMGQAPQHRMQGRNLARRARAGMEMARFSAVISCSR